MDEYIEKVDKIYDPLVDKLFIESNYGLPKRFEDIMSDIEVFEINKKLKLKLKKMVLKFIGRTTYEFIALNIAHNIKHLNFNRNFDYMFEYGLNLSSQSDYWHNRLCNGIETGDPLIYIYKYKNILKSCLDLLRHLELTLLEILRSSSNTYLNALPKDITNEITKYL